MKFARLPYRHLALAVLLAAAAVPANAQLGLPSLAMPQRVGPLETDLLRRPVEQLLDRSPLPELGRLRLEQAAALLARHPQVLEADPRGNLAVRGQILAWSPGPAGLRAAAEAGLTVVREEAYPELAQRLVVFGVPAGLASARLLDALRAADPEGAYDFNHVFGAGASDGSRPAAADAGAPGRRRPGGAPAPGVRVGLIDSGVERDHVVFAGARLQSWGCGGKAHPAAHGTAVAALMVGSSAHFEGAAPGASLYAADVYCDSPAGGAVDRIADALAWLARQEVGVINISLVGPANAALARAVAAMQARGHLLVAAVGNDGPAAPPLYPASYPGVVGVSGVDRRSRPLPEAARGPQVMFAAPGSQMVSAVPGTPPYRQVRGTSYAAPIVSALLARHLPAPGTDAARRAVAALAREAMRAEADTVSNETGLGIVGAWVRTDPSRLR
ncbi:S8 family serine peptidase [Massilia consociata]|uniref:S8 family serine peptidase n=1 Tax=Massilia consociata TaxID=760117 RepID=A0ABV6FEX6_9BURK